jgi:ribosome biogenesis GTPase / thiamine phosphate phosphatase
VVGDAGRLALSRPAGRADLDEDDVRVRAGRGSRPRTRRRPAHEDAVAAFVAAIDRGRYRCVITADPAGAAGPPGGTGAAAEAQVTAMKARELGHRSVVVGDIVRLAGDTSGAPGTLARIVSVAPRRSELRRSADDTDPVERVIVANADQLVIVCALADPPPRPRLIDRFLVAAYDAGLDPLLCLTKSDLAPPGELLARYAPLGIPHVVLGRPLTETLLAALRAALADRVSVLVGHSGVGKSTLVNALVPAADRAVGKVNPVTGRGRHTSSSAVALRLATGPAGSGPAGSGPAGSGPAAVGLTGSGWIIDTPGLRSFGLGHVSADRVLAAFTDLAEGTAGCPPGCTHLEAGCALDSFVREHGGGPLAARLDSLRRLLRSREDGDTG